MTNILDSIKRVFGLPVTQTIPQQLSPGQSLSRVAPSRQPTPLGYNWTQIGGSRIGQHDSYDDIFPYSNAIAQRFSTVIPYAVGPDNNRISPDPPAIAALYAPNDTYSCLQFLKFMAVNMLTQSHLDILVWTRPTPNAKAIPGGTVTRDNIAGYTFLPLDSRVYNGSRTDWYHQVTMTIDGLEQPMKFTRDEVIALSYSQHPEDPTRGISPAMTIHKWANLNDCIADFEQGFFDNGAVPAGMIGIVAQSPEDFEKTKNQMEESFRGADKANGVLYNYIPVDPVNNRPQDHGKIIWVPFQQANNSLDLESLDSMVNNRLASGMGVPDIVRGIDDSQTYNNAQMAERSFIENTLKPLLMTVWDVFQFELDRITGGLGYAINFDLDLPAQTDVENVQAQTQATQVSTLINLVNAGASVQSAVKALGLPEEYASLELTPAVSAVQAEQSQQPITNIVMSQPPQQIQQESAKQLDSEPTSDDKPKTDYEKVLDLSKHMLQSLVDIARQGKFSQEDDMDRVAVEWVDGTYAALEDRILRYAKTNGVTLRQAVIELAKTDPAIKDIVSQTTDEQWANLYDWNTLPMDYRTAYMQRLTHVAQDATRNGYNAIQRILTKAYNEQWDRDRLFDELAAFVNGDRAALLARNETVNSQRLGALFSAKNMSDDLGVEITKVWTAVVSDPCPFCAKMNGKAIGIDDVFMKVGDTMTIDGKDYVNTFADKDTCDGHPNCRCVLTYQVKGVKS